jgi:hypothetical protein
MAKPPAKVEQAASDQKRAGYLDIGKKGVFSESGVDQSALNNGANTYNQPNKTIGNIIAINRKNIQLTPVAEESMELYPRAENKIKLTLSSNHVALMCLLPETTDLLARDLRRNQNLSFSNISVPPLR